MMAHFETNCDTNVTNSMKHIRTINSLAILFHATQIFKVQITRTYLNYICVNTWSIMLAVSYPFQRNEMF